MLAGNLSGMRLFRGIAPCRAWLRLLPVLVGLAASPACAQGAESTAPAPDTAFAAIVERLSEPGGFFDTDNLISNEGSYLHVMGALRRAGLSGGAYIGVGPDQNFSYIAQIRPSIALIVDIRRDNLLEHLLFKSLFQLSQDRLGYLGALLARQVPEIRDAEQSIEEIVALLDGTPSDSTLFAETHDKVVSLILSYGVPITESEWETIRRFHYTFAARGLDLQFESFGREPQAYYPSLRQLILERDLEGGMVSYLASDSAFQTIRRLQLASRIIPVVGNLAGSKALPEIAEFLRERGELVSAYYVSNADFYIAEDGKLSTFLANVRDLPHNERSVIIRSVFRAPFGGGPVPQPIGGYRSTQLLQSMRTLVAESDAGRVRTYYDVVSVGSIPTR